MSSTKRISKEYAELTASPPENFTVALPPSQSLHTMHIVHSPPAPSPFHPGTYALVLSLPTTYPFKPPTLRFATRVYHPNVTNDEAGAVCLAALKAENWKPSTKITQVLEAVAALMQEPVPDDPLEETIADEYRNDRAKWERNAKSYVEKYAMGEPRFPGGD
jgi:ubiquitin-protein ligase